MSRPAAVENGEARAFPFVSDERCQHHPGLLKREFFAVFAMQGLLASADRRPPTTVAGDAVRFADELLMELALARRP